MIELDGDVKRVAQAPPVSHREKPAPLLETYREFARHCFERLGVLREKTLLHLHTFATLAENFLAEALVELVHCGLRRRDHAACAGCFSKCLP